MNNRGQSQSWDEEVIGYPAQLNLQNIEIDRRSTENIGIRIEFIDLQVPC